MDILIVDDEPTASTLHSAYVRKLGNFTAVCFGDPRDALHWAAAHEPVIVIVDYLMPHLDGIEFTRRFRDLPGKATVPVIMVTDHDDNDLRQLATNTGVNQFLSKPVDRIALSACIRKFSDAMQVSQKAPPAPGPASDYDGLNAETLATILAARDRLRDLKDGPYEAEADMPPRAAVEPPLRAPSDVLLLLDDERTSIAMLDEYVRQLKCYPMRFGQPAAALEWCETHEPLAAIVEYMMPEMNGIEFIRRFRLLPGKADTPVLMITAHRESNLMDAAVTAGVNEFLYKPVDGSHLMAHLRTILAARDLERRLSKHQQLGR